MDRPLIHRIPSFSPLDTRYLTQRKYVLLEARCVRGLWLRFLFLVLRISIKGPIMPCFSLSFWSWLYYIYRWGNWLCIYHIHKCGTLREIDETGNISNTSPRRYTVFGKIARREEPSKAEQQVMYNSRKQARDTAGVRVPCACRAGGELWGKQSPPWQRNRVVDGLLWKVNTKQESHISSVQR